MLEKQTVVVNWTSLHLAVVYDDVGVVEALKKEIPKLGGVADAIGQTPLHLSSYRSPRWVTELPRQTCLASA